MWEQGGSGEDVRRDAGCIHRHVTRGGAVSSICKRGCVYHALGIGDTGAGSSGSHGIPDIIPSHQEGETGFLFTPGDLEDCVGKLDAVLASPELRERMSAAGRIEVEKHDWRAATRHVRNEYNAAIWFWQKRRHQLSRWLAWAFRRTTSIGRLETSS
mgnify:CR=1 FL=1